MFADDEYAKLNSKLTNTEVYAFSPGVELVLMQGMQQCDGATSSWEADQDLVSGADHVVLMDGLQTEQSNESMNKTKFKSFGFWETFLMSIEIEE